MRARAFVHQICCRVLHKVHRKRGAAITAAVEGLIEGGRLSVTGVGRGLAAATSPKHCIKRVDRLLSNSRLAAERAQILQELASIVLSGTKQAPILIDWTKAVSGFYALVAAIPIGGRALPIYFEVHPIAKEGNPVVQRRFLKALGSILPPGFQPIIVADAGFQGPFIRACKGLGWHYVIRVRGRTTLRLTGDEQSTNRASLCGRATDRPHDFGDSVLYVSGKNKSTRPTRTRLVLSAKYRRKGRHRWWRKPRSGTQKGAVKAAKEPWVLATSFTLLAAEDVVSLYATRMQIEETFRDAKNHRFGWSFRYARSGSASRLEALLLLAALAMLIVNFVGIAAESQRLHRRYQANTVSRRTLSRFVLGLAVIRRHNCDDLTAIARCAAAVITEYLAALYATQAA